MTLIDIKRTESVLISFQESKKKLGRLYGETSQTSEQLNHLSGMLQIRRTLEAVMEDLQEEWEVLAQMSGCLEGICKTCIRYEEEITDFAEETATIRAVKGTIYGELGDIPIPNLLFELLG